MSNTPNDAFAKLKQLIGERAQVETGTYVGTGEYGENNPNRLTFSLSPQLVIVHSNSSSLVVFVRDIKYTIYSFSSEVQFNRVNIPTWTENGLEWYCIKIGNTLASAYRQFNSLTGAYTYIAIG